MKHPVERYTFSFIYPVSGWLKCIDNWRIIIYNHIYWNELWGWSHLLRLHASPVYKSIYRAKKCQICTGYSHHISCPIMVTLGKLCLLFLTSFKDNHHRHHYHPHDHCRNTCNMKVSKMHKTFMQKCTGHHIGCPNITTLGKLIYSGFTKST